MRFALWLVGLFAVATALALFAGSDPGTVTVFWPPYRVDLSLNLALLLLLVAFLLLYLALRALSKLFALPRQAEQWRVQHRARAQHAALLDAWSRLNAGQPGRAARVAQTVLTQLDAAPLPAGHVVDREETARQQARLRTVAHWLLAHSAHARSNRVERERQLADALTAAGTAGPGGWRDAALLQAAEWAVDAQRSAAEVRDRRPRVEAVDPAFSASDQGADPRPCEAADLALAALPPAVRRRVAARRLHLQAAIADGATLEALRVARQLARHGLLKDATHVRCQLACAHLRAAGGNAAAWRAAWDELDATERAWPAVEQLAAPRSGHVGGEGLAAR